VAINPNPPGLVLDSQGVAIPPRRPYDSIESYERLYRTDWASVDELKASLASAPPAEGLPDQAPDPNDVFLYEGRLVRYVVDPAEQRRFVVRNGAVEEDTAFKRQAVALSLAGARSETDAGRETDFWCGFSWVRGGYSLERTFPVMVQVAAIGAGDRMVFTQPASPSDTARLRHELARVDRQTPPMPVETGAPAPKGKRGKQTSPAAALPDTSGAFDVPPTED
jgi:hypothetical protein